jgi:hypothetical protein
VAATPTGVLGVDLNEHHLAACVLDASGNPVGEPVTIAVATAGLAACRRDGRVRAAITALLDHADQHNCPVVVVSGVDVCAALWLVSPPRSSGIA